MQNNITLHNIKNIQNQSYNRTINKAVPLPTIRHQLLQRVAKSSAPQKTYLSKIKSFFLRQKVWIQKPIKGERGITFVKKLK